MPDEIKRSEWVAFFTEFNKRNHGRPTTLQVLGEIGAGAEERNLPFLGIDVEKKGPDSPSVHIMLGGAAAGTPHLTHTLARVRRVLQKIGDDGADDALEIEDGNGTRTILQFTRLPELQAT